MTAPKTSRNTPLLTRDGGFQISRTAVVHVTPDERVQDLGGNFGLPRGCGSPLLFAIARDPNTIFASWSIDWQSVFENVTPADRQVHLRVYGEDGSEELRVTVEPMASMHYVTGSQLHGAYRLDIGYFQPADVWHSIAVSNEVLMPRNKIAEAADVDLATIPFHLGFQQLLDLFTARSEMPLAVAISRLENRVLSSEQPIRPVAEDGRILRALEISLSEIAAARQIFRQIDSRRLARRTGGLYKLVASSPSRGFGDTSWS